jgi:tRNA uridine 5-carboxymethylaminomethyl modification enzyme
LVESKYKDYLERQRRDVDLLKSENFEIPDDINYDNIQGLSIEARQQLKKHRPLNIASSKLIPSITPVTILAIINHIKSRNA